MIVILRRAPIRVGASPVNGHRVLLAGGHEPPGWWRPVLLAGGLLIFEFPNPRVGLHPSGPQRRDRHRVLRLSAHIGHRRHAVLFAGQRFTRALTREPSFRYRSSSGPASAVTAAQAAPGDGRACAATPRGASGRDSLALGMGSADWRQQRTVLEQGATSSSRNSGGRKCSIRLDHVRWVRIGA